MSLREELNQREQQWRLFHEAERQMITPQREPSRILADLSFLLRFCPQDEILRDPDPEKRGIAVMREALARFARQ